MPQGIDIGTIPQPVVQVNLFQKFADFLHTAPIHANNSIAHPVVDFRIIWQQDDGHFGVSAGGLALAIQLPSVSALVGVRSADSQPHQPASWLLWKHVDLQNFAGEDKLAPDGAADLSLGINSTLTIHSQTLGERTQSCVFHKVGSKPETAPGNTSASITTLFTANETEGAASAMILSLTARYWGEPIIK
ncbi:hypothetical protein SE17_29035 [Kouleothrix aurantiaca]|uniref:Uncharacterized protein n=1 Tax=Kouleothrix aurantiaca TaxID=186479 RepID=A0A0P9DC55_9CHLR|nr:hypothetical protein SE17_29035 [Kouleothrix aurantiaca]